MPVGHGELSTASTRAADRYVISTWTDEFKATIQQRILRFLRRPSSVQRVYDELRWTPLVIRQGIQSLLDEKRVEVYAERRLMVRKT